VEASRQRLRPILMTSFAFILGVVPLVVADGAGFEMRRSLGIAVFSGMLGVTLFGIFLTPVFFSAIQSVGWTSKRPAPPKDQPDGEHPGTNNGKQHDQHPAEHDGKPSDAPLAPSVQPAG
jgi:hypothetical protein